MYITTQNAGFLLSASSCIWTESYPKFPVYGQNVRVCPYTGKKGYNSVHIRENTDKRKPAFWRSATQRFSYQTFNQNLNIAKYKEISVIKKLHYSEVLPCDEFICSNFPLIGLVCVILIETRPCLTFLFR